MKAFSSLNLNIDARGVAFLTLNRPDAHNSMDPVLIQELTEAADYLGNLDSVRMVVLSGSDTGSFCAGGDLKWMRSNFDKTRLERVHDSSKLATMLSTLDTLPKFLIGRINGSAYGGGLGLISVCDVAIAIDEAKFCLTETTLGLTPATISPYVVARIGAANARSLFLNARPFGAQRARETGLLHAVVPKLELDDAVEKEILLALRCAPGAVAATKELIRFVASHDNATNRNYTADRLADAWETTEGQHGVHCFFDKREPDWRRGSD